MTGQLEDSLRHEIESYIEGRLGSIKEEISELQKQLNESLTRLLDRQADVQLDGSLAATILEHLRAAHEQGVDLAAAESSRAKASSDMAIVKAAIEEIYSQHSQADILKTLVNRAAAFAPRVAFFVIKGEQANGWRARGFEGTVGDNAIQQISLSTNSDTVLGEVAKSKTTFSGQPDSHREDHILLNKLGDEPPQRIISIPLTVRGRVVALLYADSAGLDSEAINLEALETLAHVAGMAVELVSVSRARSAAGAEGREKMQESLSGYKSQDSLSGYKSQESLSGYTPTREYEQPAPAAVGKGAFAVDTLRPEAPVSAPQPPPQPEPEAVEPVRVEHPTPVSVEPVYTSTSSEPAAAPLGSRRRYGMDAELPVAVANDEERRLHNDARRFARLLVSEIKLYNEQKVIEGRSQSDLYDRLREYIDRSREMYDKRVKPEVAVRFDYFHNELVHTLAEDDAAKLGANYPGATVTA